MLYKVRQWLGIYFLKGCGYSSRDIGIMSLNKLFRDVPKGTKYCITEEFLDNYSINSEDLELYFTAIKFDYSRMQYTCKKS